jgi:hypothetical protein
MVLLSRIAKIANCFAFLDIEVLLYRIAKNAKCFAILDSKNGKFFCYPG